MGPTRGTIASGRVPMFVSYPHAFASSIEMHLYLNKLRKTIRTTFSQKKITYKEIPSSIALPID